MSIALSKYLREVVTRSRCSTSDPGAEVEDFLQVSFEPLRRWFGSTFEETASSIGGTL